MAGSAMGMFANRRTVLWYGLLGLALIVAPFYFGSYFLSQIVFVMIYAIVGVGLVLLSGYAGQVSIGHAAFLAIGAYTAAVAQQYGLPLFVYLPLACLLTGLIGYLVGLPALRLHGIYLAIATFAFAFIVEEILARWERVTHGNEGLMLKPATFFNMKLGEAGFFYLCVLCLVAAMVVANNIIRSPTGRAFFALRDSETAAKSMGVDPARYKTFAFAVSAAMTGLAGVLYAHKLSFISPEMFTLTLSIEFIMIVIIGGIASLRGAVLGSIFMIMVDPVLVLIRDRLPKLLGAGLEAFGMVATNAAMIQAKTAKVLEAPGIKSLIFGVIIIFFIIYEPMGLDGRWQKIKIYFKQFPFYKASTFRRQKMYLKSERNR